MEESEIAIKELLGPRLSKSRSYIRLKGDSKIVKHKIATEIEGSFQNKNNTKYILLKASFFFCGI